MSVSAAPEEMKSTKQSERSGRLRNFNEALNNGLANDDDDDEVRQNNARIHYRLCRDFSREMTSAEMCVYQDDLLGALYHGSLAEMMDRRLTELEK